MIQGSDHWMKLRGQGCRTGMVIMLNIHNHLFDTLCLHTSVFLVYIPRSFMKALIADIILTTQMCLMLLSSFNSKSISKRIPVYVFFASFISYSSFRSWTTKRSVTVSAVNEHQSQWHKENSRENISKISVLHWGTNLIPPLKI
jgi:hypothetical protein